MAIGDIVWVNLPYTNLREIALSRRDLRAGRRPSLLPQEQ